MITASYKELSDKLEELHPNGRFTVLEIAELLDVDRANAAALLKLMVGEGRLRQPYKRGRSKLYTFAD